MKENKKSYLISTLADLLLLAIVENMSKIWILNQRLLEVY